MTGIGGGFAPDNTLILFWDITWKTGKLGREFESHAFYLTNGKTAVATDWSRPNIFYWMVKGGAQDLPKTPKICQYCQADGDDVQQGRMLLPQMDGIADPISSTPDSGSRDEDDEDNNPYSQGQHRMSRQPTGYGWP